MTKYVQIGDRIHMQNTTEEIIKAGDVVALGTDRAGVAQARILPGEVGAVSLTGVYEFPANNTKALDIGSQIGWDPITGLAGAAGEGLLRLGMAVQKKESAGKTVLVRLE